MKNKIAVWCALFALLVALVPTSSARADEFGVYDESVAEILNTIPDAVLALMDEYHYVVGSDGAHINILIYNSGSVPIAVQSRNDFGYEHLQGVTSNNVGASGICYWHNGSEWQTGGTGLVSIFGGSGFNSVLYASSLNEFYDRDWNLITDDVPTYSEFMGLDGYRFSQWCSDAGLKCQASSNESASVIPYSYNDYWHIVRKTSSGKWLLTTVGNSVSQENASDYTFVYSEDMSTLKVLNLYSGEDTNGYLLIVRQYEYDTDGWKVRTYETYDARETEDNYIDLGAGSGVDDTRVLAYTNVNIYDENFELVTSASTEYVEPTTPEVTPEVTPEPTPDAGSGGDSSDSGGTGSDGGGTGGGTRPETNVDLGVDLDDITLEDIPETIKNIKDTIKEFLGLVGVVPLMIGAVFGFLPDWCLWVLGVSFAFVGILLIIKLIRG